MQYSTHYIHDDNDAGWHHTNVCIYVLYDKVIDNVRYNTQSRRLVFMYLDDTLSQERPAAERLMYIRVSE